MQHCDQAALSLISLGEPASDPDAAHLAGCRSCRAELARLTTVVTAVRVDLPPGPPIAPPPRVWAAVAAQTGLGGPARVSDLTGRNARSRGASSRIRAGGRRTSRRRTALQDERGARSSGRTGWARLVAVAAGALVVGGVAGSAVTQWVGDRGPAPATTLVLTQTGLRGLALAPRADGRALVVRTTSGTQLDVDVSALGALDHDFYEVWLIDSTVTKMVPVGILRGSTGEFVLPPGLDLREYPIVDISIETPGDPRHSGKSVLRGTLTA